MSNVEQDAFAAIVRQLDHDPLEAEPAPAPVPPTWTDTEAVASLVDVYRLNVAAASADPAAVAAAVNPLLALPIFA
jgi:hypothetical protein